MKIVKSMLAAIAIAATWTAAYGAMPPGASYETTVHLSDGKTVNCDVNGSPREPTSHVMLSTREQTEADVLATRRLRLISGPASDYPSPYTAPSVVCTPAA
jgi:hypothetical protein